MPQLPRWVIPIKPNSSIFSQTLKMARLAIFPKPICLLDRRFGSYHKPENAAANPTEVPIPVPLADELVPLQGQLPSPTTKPVFCFPKRSPSGCKIGKSNKGQTNPGRRNKGAVDQRTAHHWGIPKNGSPARPVLAD